jgi:hypothetical protein
MDSHTDRLLPLAEQTARLLAAHRAVALDPTAAARLAHVTRQLEVELLAHRLRTVEPVPMALATPPTLTA